MFYFTKKVLGVFLFTILFASTLFATEIVVSGFTNSQYKSGGTTAKMRVYLSERIVTSDGKVLMPSRVDANNWYKEINCTVSGATLACPSFTIDSTVDSSVKDAAYTFVFLDQKNTKTSQFNNLRIPSTPNPTTFSAILLYNNISSPRAAAFVTTDTGSLQPNNSPLAQQTSDNRNPVRKTLALDYSNSLASAVSSVGTRDMELVVTASTNVSSTMTIPENVRVVLEAGAQISVAPGQTLTISSMEDAGNRKIFSGAGNVKLMPRAVPYFNLTWWTGTDDSIDVTDGINGAIKNITANGGGSLYVPIGAWKTRGGHILPSHIVLFGQSTRSDGVFATSSFVLLSGSNSDAIMKIQESYRQVSIRDLTFNVGTSTTASGFIAEGHAPNSAHGLDFRNVTWHGLGENSPAQVLIKDLGNDWETLQINFDHCSWIVPPGGIGVGSTTVNTGINFLQPFFYIGSGGTAAKFDRVANVNFTNPTFNGTINVAADTTINRTINQATIQAGTKNLIISGGAFSQNDIGQKVVINNKLNARITGITNATTATVDQNATATASNEQMTINYFSPSSRHAKAAIHLAGGRANVTVVGSQDEGLQYFLIVDGSQYDFPIGLFNNNIQSTILLNATCTINSTGNKYFSNTYEDAVNSASRIISVGDYVDKTTRNFDESGVGAELVEPKLFGVKRGVSLVQSELGSKQGYYRQTFGMPTDVIYDYETYKFNAPTDEPVFGVGSAYEKPLLRVGKVDSVTNKFNYYYDFKRNDANGRLEITGNQEGYKGYDFDADITAKSFNRGKPIAMANAPVSQMSGIQGDVFTLSPNQNMQIDAVAMKPGQEIFLIITTAGTTNYKITPGKYLKTNGSLQTGTASGKSFVIHFICDGTRLLEVSRTTAM